MPSTSQTSTGRIRLFQLAGITVFLHWSWFLVAVYEIGERQRSYSSIVWNVLEYLALFAIVTMHEFGHSLACRGVGGQANQIVLWPLGGVAIVDPPPRPGATLWSIAAGPLVNVALLPVLAGMVLFSAFSGLAAAAPDAHTFLRALLGMDVAMLVFNLLPVYPLDGGQILRALLWYMIGRAQSLMVAAGIGFIGVAGLVVLAVIVQSGWLVFIAVFAALQCAAGFHHARSLERMAEAIRRKDFACPSCGAGAPTGAFWRCAACHRAFDPFAHNPLPVPVPAVFSHRLLNLSVQKPPAPIETRSGLAACPNCRAHFRDAKCPDCGVVSLFGDWDAGATLSEGRRASAGTASHSG